MGNFKKLHLELYSYDGVFQGYLSHISIYNSKVESTPYINNSKSYAREQTAIKDGELVAALTHGGLLYKVV